MKKQKAKLLACLLAASCGVACLGVGVAAIDDSLSAPYVVSAEATKTATITKLTALASSSSTVIYAYQDESVKIVNSWTDAFTFVEGTGEGFLFNGEKLASYEVKQPGDFYIVPTGKEAVAGDKVVLDGTFRNDALDAEFVFVNCGLQFNGTTWETYSENADPDPKPEAVTHNIGSLEVAVHSNGVGGFSTNNAALYTVRADGEALPFQAWENPFTVVEGGLKVNDNPVGLNEMQSAPEGLYFTFDEINENDVLTIGGTFYCEKQNIKYVIEETKFTWLGSKWELYKEKAEAKSTTITKLTALASSTATHIEAYQTAADKIANNWDKLSFVEGSGTGVTLNGDAVGYSICQVNDFVIDLTEEAEAGDVLVVDGTFYNETANAEFVFVNCTLQYDGTTWAKPKMTYNIGSLDFHVNSSVGGASGLNDALYLQRADGGELPFKAWENPFYETAGGLKVNGEPVDLIEMQSTGDGLYFKFDELEANDVLTIGGTFYCEKQGIEYVIEESKFVWSGSKWEKYIKYETYEIGSLLVNANESAANAIHMRRADGEAMPVASWDHRFYFLAGSGYGAKLNGEDLPSEDMKSPGGTFYVGLGMKAEAGDVFTIKSEAKRS